MSEHQIRLRGGWESYAEGAAAGERRRVTLPLTWPAGITAPVRLVRRFASPSLDDRLESMALRLESVPGLIAAWLNDREIVRPNGQGSDFVLALDEPLPARNVLAIEVDPVEAAAAGGGDWGRIALVIVARGAAGEAQRPSGE